MRSIVLANLVAGGTWLCALACFPAARRVNHDQGAERLLAADLLPAFCKFIGAALPKEVEFGEQLFPRCLGSPGWNHICDGLD